MIVETPSKVILFGEHAVVYGYRAIAMAIDLISTVEIKKIGGNEIILNLNDLNKSLRLDLEDKYAYLLLNKEITSFLRLNLDDIRNINPNNFPNNFNDFKYCLCAIKNTLNYLDIEPKIAFEINISPKIPVSCGLGSSASITIGVIKAVSRFYDRELKDDEIAKLGYTVEKEVQGKASVTDTSTITYRGILEIKNNKPRKIKGKFEEFLKSCRFLVVYVEERKKKTAELVNEVAKLEYKDDIFKEIDKIIDKALKANSKEEFGKLLTKNHELLKN